MNEIQLGKMYLVKEWFWFLYPTKEMVVEAYTCGVPNVPHSSHISVYAHGKAKTIGTTKSCNVYVAEPKTCIVLLDQQKTELGKVYQILNSNGNIGWIRCHGAFTDYFEIINQ